MNRIRLLPEQVANQIAAGEVVERPASVVKELVENALDAQATRITVEIQAGGRSLIRITDDGFGMSKDDALLSLERHATSKIQKAEDLFAIQTMGFRGEAIPSIASVSRMTITSRERDGDSPEGTQIVINGGRILEVKAAGCAPGTSIEVRQIFFNVPARRKFLRAEETERAHIQHYLTLVALAFPRVALTFVQDGRTIWRLPGVDISADRIRALRERFAALYGADYEMLEVDFNSEIETFHESDGDHDVVPSRDPFKLWGLIGAPGVSRTTREDQHLFVNRRPVDNRGLSYALLEGYHTMLMKGRYPICVLFLEISPTVVDVNIHPSKREVKFHREQDVRRLVTQAIRNVLMRYHARSASQPQAPELPQLTPQEKTLFLSPAPAPKPSETPPQFPPPPVTPVLPNFVPPLPQRPLAPWPERPLSEPQLPRSLPLEPSPAPPPIAQSLAPVPLLEVPLRLIGVVGKLYVLLESDRGLVLLDQHAAHERILFEQMLKRLEQGAAPSQRLLLPHTIELSPRDATFLRQHLENLTRLGVGLSEFGERTFLLDSVPPFVKVPDAKQFVVQLIDALKAVGQEVNNWRLGEDMIAKTVCRHAVKANDPLSGPELENLVNDLRRCEMPYTCPHGRPTLIEMNYRELEKKFGRIQ